MGDDANSWVRRLKFSHTVCHRLDSFKLLTTPVSVEANLGIADSRPRVSDARFVAASESKAASLESDHRLGASGLRSKRREMAARRKERSLSPLPARCQTMDAFKEAKAEMKRFSTPHPRRKSQGKGFFAKLFSGEAQRRRDRSLSWPSQSKPAQHRSSAKTSNKTKGRKENTQVRCFDHGGGRVTALDSMEEWKGDLSKLYIGGKFACGGHSKLYHGVYKDQPVAVKVITLPNDDDEDETMATRLENEFIREVNLLSHLFHGNVIKHEVRSWWKHWPDSDEHHSCGAVGGSM